MQETQVVICFRNYRLFKSLWETEKNLSNDNAPGSSVSVSKCRSGVAPLRIETGRYEGLCINDRTCPFCKTCTEDEFHVLFKCRLYYKLRIDLFRNVHTYDSTFDVLNEPREVLCFIQ